MRSPSHMVPRLNSKTSKISGRATVDRTSKSGLLFYDVNY